tara:strand:- start:2420 stop:2935 length:516 start_codon:yes stop_codon:yes gene_type:complete
MTILRAYLSKSKVKKVLATKPGEEGFSLIELVVVVAVLAILSAIAIPSFTDMSDKARATAAANTVAQVVKECAVKIADAGSGKFVPPINMDGYKTGASAGWFNSASGSKAASSSEIDCVETGVVSLRSENLDKWPTFKFDYDNNLKICEATAGKKGDGRVCNLVSGNNGEW